MRARQVSFSVAYPERKESSVSLSIGWSPALAEAYRDDDAEEDPCTEAEVALFRAIVPHLSGAVRLPGALVPLVHHVAAPR